MASTVTSKGKKRLMTNNGKVQVNLNDNRLLQYDGVKYRFLIGDKANGEHKVLMSKENENVLDV